MSKQRNLFSFFSTKEPAPPPKSASAPLLASSASASASSGSSSSPSSAAAGAAAKSSTATSVGRGGGSNGSGNNVAGAAPRKGGDAASSSSSSSSSAAAAAAVARQHKLLSRVTVGTKLAVYWPDDDEYYPCAIRTHRRRRGPDPGHLYELHYDDGEVETVDLAKEKFRIIGGKKKKKKDEDEGGEEEEEENAAAKSSSSAKKRRRILEESSEDDDEFDEGEGDESEEKEDDEDDSGSEYKMAAGDDSAADDSLIAVGEKEDWLESEEEEEEEEESPKKKKRKGAVVKKITVAKVGKNGSATTDGERLVSPTPMKSTTRGEADADGTTRKKAVVKDIDFSSFLSQSPSGGGGGGGSREPAASKADVTQSQNSPVVPEGNGGGRAGKSPPPPSSTTAAAGTTMGAAVPKPVPGAVNPAGTHMHNHLRFFTSDRRDAKGNRAGHPCHSPRTLTVDYAELAGHQETGKVTAAQRQWWEIKSQYADTVLLFKTGKFYEMFHDDADVGAGVLGFVYMKGASAHAGFPEGAYGTMVSRLVQAGCKVARVEQTETPDALQERKKRMPKGQKKPEVVCREVCSVVSKGTRTFCYLDDVRLLESGEACTGPLVVIKEALVEDGPDDEGGMDVDGEGGGVGGTKAICEYGVTIVDAVTGVVTLGQFADDVLRSRMQTLMARFSPSEVSENDRGGDANHQSPVPSRPNDSFSLRCCMREARMVHPKP